MIIITNESLITQTMIGKKALFYHFPFVVEKFKQILFLFQVTILVNVSNAGQSLLWHPERSFCSAETSGIHSTWMPSPTTKSSGGSPTASCSRKSLKVFLNFITEQIQCTRNLLFYCWCFTFVQKKWFAMFSFDKTAFKLQSFCCFSIVWKEWVKLVSRVHKGLNTKMRNWKCCERFLA